MDEEKDVATMDKTGMDIVDSEDSITKSLVALEGSELEKAKLDEDSCMAGMLLCNVRNMTEP